MRLISNMDRCFHSSCDLEIEEVINNEAKGLTIIDGSETTFVSMRNIETFFIYKNMFIISLNLLDQERIDRIVNTLNLVLSGLPNDEEKATILYRYLLYVQFYTAFRSWQVVSMRGPP